jgi:hypothetical protein
VQGRLDYGDKVILSTERWREIAAIDPDPCARERATAKNFV